MTVSSPSVARQRALAERAHGCGVASPIRIGGPATKESPADAERAAERKRRSAMDRSIALHYMRLCHNGLHQFPHDLLQRLFRRPDPLERQGVERLVGQVEHADEALLLGAEVD